ncbi:MAG: lipopolysaccharide biosynthesis protein [Legionellaceae bacterium]
MLLIAFGRLAQFFIMLLTLRLASTYLTPDDLGKMAIITTAMALLSSLLINPVGMYVNRQLHTWNSTGDVRQYLGMHWAYIFMTAIFSAGLLSLGQMLGVLHLHFQTSFVFIFVFLSLFFNTINQTTIPSLNMLGFRGWFTLLSVGTLVLSLIGALSMLLMFGRSSSSWLFGLLLGQITLGLYGGIILYKKIGPARSEKKPGSILALNTIFQFSCPIALTVGLTWIQSQSYRFFIEDAFGLSTLGLFVAGYGISAGVIAGFEAVFTTYFQPAFYKKISQGNETQRTEAWNVYAQAILPTLVVVCGVLVLLSSAITSLILAPTFQSAARFLVWGALIESCRVIVNVYSMVMYAEKNTRLLIFPNAIGAIVSLVLMLCLIPKMGIVGVGMGLGISGVLVVGVYHVVIKKRHAIRLPYQQISFSFIFTLILCLIHTLMDRSMASTHMVFSHLIEMSVFGLFCLVFWRFLLKDE